MSNTEQGKFFSLLNASLNPDFLIFDQLISNPTESLNEKRTNKGESF
jgi:hypothetical protein